MTKKQLILEHLKKYKSITPKEAYFEYGSMRLGAIIFELRKTYKIRTNMIDVPTRFGNSTVAQYVYEGAIAKW